MDGDLHPVSQPEADLWECRRVERELIAGVRTELTVEVWSDVVCPWCYIGKRRFEQALESFEHRDDVTVVYRSFQLDPNAAPFDPAAPVEDHAEYLARKFGGGRERGLQLIEHVTNIAAESGLHYDLLHAQGGNTRDAHRLLHAALEDGGAALQSAVKERFLAAYFTEAAAIADPAVLTRLAVEAGMTPERVSQVLDGSLYADAVAADQLEAQHLGANGVPFFVIDRRFGVSGAQPAGLFEQALQQAWDAPVEG